MFHNYFFLKRLADSLDSKLKGLLLLECYSQNKNELILGFGNEKKDEVWLRANLDPQVCLLQVVSDFRRAKKNSVSLFSELLDKKVKGVSVFSFERSFKLTFENDFDLIFKMHGSRSNLVLVQAGTVISIFRNQLPNDHELKPEYLDQPLEISRHRFEKEEGNPSKFIPALGKEARGHLMKHGYEQLNLEEKWVEMQNLLRALDTNPIYIFTENERPFLSLLPPEDGVLLETTDPLEAANYLYQSFTRSFYLGREKQNVIRTIETRIKKTEGYVQKTSEKLRSIKESRSYEELANIIMANLHQIPVRQKMVTLYDFYNDRQVDVKLNPELSPQKNAENLYRKAKNQKIEIEKLEGNISSKKEQLTQLRKKLAEVENSEDIRYIRKEFGQNPTQKDETPLPYHRFSFSGYDILVGKNAKSNDTLTLKVAHKNDYWLHARDVPGSHVVIRRQAGKNLPKDVLERAGQIAAWFSKRKNDTLCPVIYTEAKYVRKRKGLAPGQVIVDKEEVMMVEPKGV